MIERYTVYNFAHCPIVHKLHVPTSLEGAVHGVTSCERVAVLSVRCICQEALCEAVRSKGISGVG